MDHQIAMLWMRGRLSYLELLCVQSFLDIGHEVVFYSYDPVENVPDGVELRDANEICPEEGFLVHAGTGSPALHSDFFRYRLLKQHPGIIWADTDAYCMRRFRTWDGHLHGWEGERDINGGVLALPEDSATLARLIEHTSDAYSVPLWMERYAGGRGRPLREAIATGGKVHAGEQPWGVWGPHAVTYFLHETGDVKFTRGHRVLYPYPYEKRRKMLDPNHIKRERFVTDETLSIHLYGRRMRRALVTKHEGVPHPESVLGQLLLKHRINPLLAPLKDSPPLNPDGEKERVFREVAEGRKSYTTAKVEDGEPVPTVRPLDRVVAVTTMRNEGPFILDWIAYHLAIGVTHFLVYTNDCDDPTVEILDALSERGLVTRIDNPAVSGERPQRVALAHAMGQRVVSNADAVIVFDVDEYINIHVGDGTLETLFNACGDPDMISMTWRLFGTSGHVAYEDEPMPLRFTRGAQHHLRRPHQAWGFKTIQRKGAPFARLGVHRPHEPVGSMPHWTNGSGKQMPDSYLEEGWRSSKNSWGYDLVTLNHYATRSVESFLVKRDRGRTNHIAREQGVDYWQAFNRNDEEDTSISKRWEAAGTIRDEFTNDPVLGPLHKLSVAWHKARIEQLKTNPREQTLFDHLSNEPLRFDIEDVVLPKASPIEKTKLRKVSRSALRSQREDDPPATGVEADTAFKNLMARIQPKQRMLTPLAAPPPAERIVIISSMKNEGCFILEWIAYHLSIGVTHFLIYTNDCDDQTNAILDRLGVLGYVTRLDNPFNREGGQKPQRGALNDAAIRPEVITADWVGVIDVDEFVNIHVGDGTFHDLLKASNDPNVISMTWRFFGNRGLDRYDDVWQTEVFTACAPKYLPKPRLGWGFKSFYRTDGPFGKLGVHRPLDLNKNRVEEVRWVNGSGRVMPDRVTQKNEWFSRKDTIGYDLVTLNHYVLRHADSFLVKRQRGRINHVDQDQGVAYWAARNYATEADTSIHARLPRAKEELARLMADEELAGLHMEAVKWHKDRIAALMAEPDYRTIFDAITDPLLPDAIWRGQNAKAELAAE